MYNLVKIKFTDATNKEKGLRVIIHNGPVVYTNQKGVYLVPAYICAMLVEHKISYEVIK